jgi:tRNA(Ile)-lysidine synthase
MRFLRGSGPAGLAAMPRERGLILRPLLDLSRSQVLSYLEERGIAFRLDSTNADSSFLRNRIRNQLVPLLDESFPGWRTSVGALGETQRLAADFLAAEAERRIPWTSGGASSGLEASYSETLLRVSDAIFFSQPEIIREEGIFLAADRLSRGREAAAPRRGSVRRFTRGGCKALDLGELRLERSKGWVVAVPRLRELSEEGFSLLIKEPGTYKLKEYRLVLRCLPEKEDGAGEEGFFAALPLVLRPVRKGDWSRMGKAQGSPLARRPCSGYTDSIAAEDYLGTAAVIGSGDGGSILIGCRDSENTGDFFFITIIPWGLDVQRSK